MPYLCTLCDIQTCASTFFSVKKQQHLFQDQQTFCFPVAIKFKKDAAFSQCGAWEKLLTRLPQPLGVCSPWAHCGLPFWVTYYILRWFMLMHQQFLSTVNMHSRVVWPVSHGQDMSPRICLRRSFPRKLMLNAVQEAHSDADKSDSWGVLWKKQNQCRLLMVVIDV